MIGLYLAKEFSHFEAALQYSDGGFNRNFYMTLDDFHAFRQQNLRHGMFTTAYRYDQENIREANMIGNLYIDFDVTDIDNNFWMIRNDAIKVVSILGAIFGIDKDMIQLYFSGNKGIHIVVPAETIGIHPHPQLNMVFKKVAEDMNKLTKHNTVDTRIYDKVRLFRVPNSIHPKTGLYKIPITFDELRDLPIDDMQKLAERPRKPIPVRKQYLTQANRMYQSYIKAYEEEERRIAARKKSGKRSSLNFMPPCIEHIINNPVPDGKRNNTTAVLASYFMQRGIKEEEAIDRIFAWNQEQCQPPQPESEIEKTIASIFRREHRYGCAALKELSVCSSSCRLYKKD